MSDVFSRVLDTWKADGIPLVRAMDYEATAKRFRAAGLEPAKDFIRFYSTVGGMIDYETDHNLWSCWSIDKIIEEMSGYPRSGICFADWLIHSHIHVVRAENEERSSVWVDYFSGNEAEKVADSLDDFLDRYLKKDETTIIFFDEPIVSNRKAELGRFRTLSLGKK